MKSMILAAMNENKHFEQQFFVSKRPGIWHRSYLNIEDAFKKP